jgi:hypothetical protein
VHGAGDVEKRWRIFTGASYLGTSERQQSGKSLLPVILLIPYRIQFDF